MRKLIICLIINALIFLTVSSSYAREYSFRTTKGEVIFTDGLYGAGLGALIGIAAFAIDDKDAGAKVGAGILVGALLGVAYGLHETNSFVEFKEGKFAINVPQPTIESRKNEILYNLSLFRAEFK